MMLSFCSKTIVNFSKQNMFKHSKIIVRIDWKIHILTMTEFYTKHGTFYFVIFSCDEAKTYFFKHEIHQNYKVQWT